MTNIVTSEYESQLEKLLPLLVDYEILSPSVPSSMKLNQTEAHRFFIFRGEKVDLQLKLVPKILSYFSKTGDFTTEELKNINLFRSVFNVQIVPTAKTKNELRSHILQVWRKLFSEVLIQTQVSKSLPQPSVLVANAMVPVSEFNPSVGFISPPGFHPPQRKLLPESMTSNQENDSFIDFYLHLPKTLIRQIIDTETASSKVVPTNLESEDEFLLYNIAIETPSNCELGTYFLGLNIEMNSERFTNLLPYNPEMSDFKPEFTELDLLLPNSTSNFYTPTLIFLSAIYKPIQIIDMLKVDTHSKLLGNMKNYIQVSIQNIHQEYTATIDNLTFHLATSQIVHQGFFKNQSLHDLSELETKPVSLPGSSSPIGLFQAFIDKTLLPIVLKPNEEISLIVMIYPSDRKNIEIATPKESKPKIAPTKFNTDTLTADINRRRSPISPPPVASHFLHEHHNWFVVETPVDLQYTVSGMKTKLHKEECAKWHAIVKKGLFASVRCSSPIVKVNQPFTVVVGLANLSPHDIYIIMTSQPSSTSGLICHDSQVDIGMIKSFDSRELELRYVAVQEGLHAIADIVCYNKQTKQQYVFPFSCQVYVQ